MYIFIKTCLLRQATPEVRGVSGGGGRRNCAPLYSFLFWLSEAQEPGVATKKKQAGWRSEASGFLAKPTPPFPPLLIYHIMMFI